jgi:arsenate reductase
MLLFHVLKERRARVLFVCLGNSYRSKMAETFAHAYGSDILEAESAGFIPARTVSHTARRLMTEKGLAMPEAPPRRWIQSELDSYDLIVNLCEYGLPKTSVPVVKILLPDPVGRPEEERREIRDEIEIIVQTMLAQFRQARDEWPWNISAEPESLPESSPESSIDSGADDSGVDRPADPAKLFWWRTHPANAQLQLGGLPV